MTWVIVGVGFFVILAIFNTERQAASIHRDLARVDRKLNLLLKHLNITFDESALSDRVKELARDPARKIEAIKAYREESGAGLAEAKRVVEEYMDSVQR